jgi:hypothetical protein
LFTALTGQQNLIRIKLEIWVRNGASERLRKEIADAAADYGAAFDAIMAKGQQRLTAPKRG